MHKKPKIVIFSGSSSLPRKHENGVLEWEDTYIYKLKEELKQYEVIRFSVGGATIRDIKDQVNYYKIIKPEKVILSVGLSDAAPRAFGKIEMILLKKAKLIRFTKPFVAFLRRYRAHHYTSPTLFERTLIEIKKDLDAQEFYSVGILPIRKDYETKLPGVTKFSDIYNEILKKHSSFISIDDIPDEGIIEDHHHFNALGRDFIFRKILNAITKKA